MSLKRLWKATGLTLVIVGLSAVHSFAIEEQTIAKNTSEENSSIWLSNSASTDRISDRESSKTGDRTPTERTNTERTNQLSISQLIASYTNR
ncbi:MAG: hypothetical protein WA947_09770 [Phormidesmis sp.]